MQAVFRNTFKVTELLYGENGSQNSLTPLPHPLLLTFYFICLIML